MRGVVIRWHTVAITVAFGTLLVLSPIAMSFEPYPEIQRDGVWSGTFVSDPSYPWRVRLITLGLVGALGTALLATRALRGGTPSPTGLMELSMALACWALGWRSYPYWVNGVFQASDMAAGGMLDPKALPPMSWIGELWRFPAMLLYPVAFAGSLGLLAAAVWVIRTSSGRQAWPWIVVLSSALTLASLIYSPEYGTWLLD